MTIYKDDLLNLLETEELKNNPEIYKELHEFLEGFKYESIIYSFRISKLSINACKYLLDNNINPSEMLKGALDLTLGDKRDQLMDLALTKNIYWSNVYLWNTESLTIAEANKFLDNGANGKIILDIALRYESGDKRDQLMDLALTKNIDWSNFYLSNVESLTITEAKKFLDNGANGKIILDIALRYESGEKRDQLMDLALTKKIDWSNVYLSNTKSLSITEAKKFLDNGANGKIILDIALTYESGEKRDQLIDLALTQKIDWHNIYLYNTDPFTIAEAKKFLDNGANGKVILDIALRNEAGEKRDQLIDLALTKKIDWNNIYLYNTESLTIVEANKLLDKGANGKIILDAALSQEAGERRDQLMDLALTQKVDWSNIYLSNTASLTIAEANKILDNGANGKIILDVALGQEAGEKRDQLIDLALTKKIDWNNLYNFSSFTLEIIEKFLNKDLPPNILLTRTLDNLRIGYDPESEIYNSASLSEVQKKFLELAIDKGADINKVFDEYCEGRSSISSSAGSMIAYIIPENILKILVQSYFLDPQYITEYAINNEVIYILDNVLGTNFNLTIKLDSYTKVFYENNLKTALILLEKFPNAYDTKQIYDHMRSFGLSEDIANNTLDFYALVHEYFAAKNGQDSMLSAHEIQILDGEYILDDIESYNKIELTNNYGYTPLHLALISNSYDVALKMVELGVDIYAKSNYNITALHLLSNLEREGKYNFIQAVSKVIDRVDVDLGSGQSLADVLIKNTALEDEVIEKSNDSLYSLFKKDVDLFLPSKDTSKTSIAISHGDGFWSDGIWSTSRLLVKNHPDVQFYLVNDYMVEKGGEDFIKQFDAVINPVAGDSYPKDLEEFSKEDCSFSMPLEIHYQNMLNQTEQFHIPYLGMCAGA